MQKLGRVAMYDVNTASIFERIALANQYPIRVIQKHENGEQVRRHKKKRTNKKWLKRYGVYSNQMLEPGAIVLAFGTLVMSQATYNKLKKEIKGQNASTQA